MKRNVITLLAVAVAGLSSHPARAELAVIVAPSVGVDSVTLEQVERLYLDKSVRGLANARLTPVDHKQGSELRKEFVRKVMGKSERQLAGYWSRVMFSGKGQPPRQYSNDAEVIEQVTSEPGKVGYIDAASVNDSTKVILRIP